MSSEVCCSPERSKNNAVVSTSKLTYCADTFVATYKLLQTLLLILFTFKLYFKLHERIIVTIWVNQWVRLYTHVDIPVAGRLLPAFSTSWITMTTCPVRCRPLLISCLLIAGIRVLCLHADSVTVNVPSLWQTKWTVDVGMFNACLLPVRERQQEAWRENNEDYDDGHYSHGIHLILIFIYLFKTRVRCLCVWRKEGFPV